MEFDFTSVESIVTLLIGALGGVVVVAVTKGWGWVKAKAAESENKIDDHIVELAEKAFKEMIEKNKPQDPPAA